MFGSKIKLSKSLMDRATEASERLGCSLLEFVERSVERELERVSPPSSANAPSQGEVDEIMGKLKGLGYLE